MFTNVLEQCAASFFRAQRGSQVWRKWFGYMEMEARMSKEATEEGQSTLSESTKLHSITSQMTIFSKICFPYQLCVMYQ
jgi:hypothetical protein